MFTFLKAQASAIAATAADFLVFLLLTWGGVYPVTATVYGNIVGGVVNFILGRQWAFNAKDKKAQGQAARYLIVWGGSLALNAGGLYLLTEKAGIDPTTAKVLTAITVALTWNYFLQKKFVFR